MDSLYLVFKMGDGPTTVRIEKYYPAKDNGQIIYSEAAEILREWANQLESGDFWETVEYEGD